jgi:GTP 3',8-cyclase
VVLRNCQFELAITTNGTLLHRHLDTLVETGVNKINISHDTLSPPTFFRITRRDKFEQTFQNIRSAVNAGMIVKLNTVVMNGINDHELIDFVSLTEKENIEVRFIEFMPFTDNGWSADKVVSKQRILDCIGQQFYFEEQPGQPVW